MRMCSVAIGRKETDKTIVSLETGEHNDPKSVRYSVVFHKGNVTEVQRKSKTSPGWRSVWGNWQERPYGLLVGGIIREAKEMLAANSQSDRGTEP